jgi:glycosyltransferase involved in cell wall biosynthesis
MRVAIMGTRGIPANYGGFETFAEELSTRLVERGHDVTVYGRAHHVPRGLRVHRGVRLVVLPTIRHKYLDTLTHTLLSVAYGAFQRYDAVVVCNAANAIFCLWLRLAGQWVLLNVDGIERKRKKWNWIGRMYYLLSEWLATFCPSAIVTDARVIQTYYRDRYHTAGHFVPYGAAAQSREAGATLKRFNLQPRQYVLYVSRLEPENNAHVVVEAFSQVETERRLVIVGDAPYSAEYIRQLKRTDDPRVIFTGYLYGDGYWELQSHAYCYVHATEVGGTHPALVEAMGAGNCVIANGTPENVEVVGDAGLVYEVNSAEDLARHLQLVLADEGLVERCRRKAREHVAAHYSWHSVTCAYEAILATRARVPAGALLQALSTPTGMPAGRL